MTHARINSPANLCTPQNTQFFNNRKTHEHVLKHLLRVYIPTNSWF